MGVNEYAQNIAWCKHCQYVTREGWCDYIGWTGHRRPCKAGKGCTARKLVEGPRRRKGWVDREKLAELYKQGLTDREISEQAKCGIATVTRWRNSAQLPSNKKKKTPPKPKRKKPTVDKEKIAELYAQGHKDEDIAKMAGCSWASVNRWRKANGLPSNCKKTT